MKDEKATGTNIALYPTDRAIVEKAMQKLQRKTFSDAVQFIIRDWAALKSELEGAQVIKRERQAAKA